MFALEYDLLTYMSAFLATFDTILNFKADFCDIETFFRFSLDIFAFQTKITLSVRRYSRIVYDARLSRLFISKKFPIEKNVRKKEKRIRDFL